MVKDNVQRQITDYTNEELFLEYHETKELMLKQELVMRYLYIVRSIAIQMRNVYVGFSQLEDIVNEGVLVLLQAIDRYEINQHVKFETFVTKRIRGMIIDIARKQDWVPRNTRKISKNIEEMANQYYSEKGHEPTIDEIAESLDLEKGKCEEILSKMALHSVLSLDMVLHEGNEQYSNTQIPSLNTEEQPEIHFMEGEMKQILVQGIERLNEKEQLVVSLYYMEELHMKDIATVLEISEARISQIHAKALVKLKDYLTKELQ